MAFGLLIACGSPPVKVQMHHVAKKRVDNSALVAVADNYYAAPDAVTMRAAVEEARKLNPKSALYHEIAGDLARLEDRIRDGHEHTIQALRDPNDDAALLHLQQLADHSWTLEERIWVENVLSAVRGNHRDADVRAYAAWMSAHAAHLRGRDEARDTALKEIGFRPPVAIIGTWDNDQGKGFDAVFPPEAELKLDAQYPGKLVKVGWRTDFPKDPRGKINLSSGLSPRKWQVAYVATAVEAAAEGEFELRLGTSDPIKVWVNEVLVFEGRRLGGWLFDGVVLPVTLRKGVNRIMIKSAQETDSWLMSLRMTGKDGAALEKGALKPAAKIDAEFALDGPVSKPVVLNEMIKARISAKPDSIRAQVQLLAWAEAMGLETARVTLAEALAKAYPKSLFVRYQLAMALWNNQERGRTADLLNDLVRTDGDALPLLAIKQARFWQQQKLTVNARKLLLSVRKKHPKRYSATLALTGLFKSEGWHEDECELLKEVDKAEPNWPSVRYQLADCYESLRFYPKAQAIYEEIEAALPNSLTALSSLHWLAQGNDQFSKAKRYAQRLIKAWPHDTIGYLRLGETLRRMGDAKGADAILAKLTEMAPTSSQGYMKQAKIALQSGDRERATDLWKHALERDPDNDGLAERVSYLAPSKEGPWAKDVPTIEQMAAAVAARAKVKPAKGADIIYLMDDEVTSLASDGSSVNVVTMVAHAVNQAGRDQLTRMRMRSGGRSRMLHAFAVDPKGRRVEASSIRGRTVRFRQLAVGSTVVLQYRNDARPDGYLAGHLARSWWFQAPSAQTYVSRWVMWVPEGTKMLEEGRGEYSREVREEGGRQRFAWSAKNTLPVIPEPSMPTLSEVATHLTISTVPSWEMFWKWEQALLRDAFRETSEIQALAQSLFITANTPQEKIDRIQEYLMTNIRYQQDYEGRIAGVKPHTAPVVVARQYGDCKDKAVLFITLARQAGIDVHFALVRTRDMGPVRRQVPMQQFNHAIVYVPKQVGIAEGRFYDPTVDALDIEVLRHDDQGTWSLVFDTQKGIHTWREIPFQAADVDYVLVDTALTIGANGTSTGVVELTSRGRVGSAFRRGARNPEQLSQILEGQVGRTFPGARVKKQETVQVTDVTKPAKVRLEIDAPAIGRREGHELRLRIPIGWSSQQYFTLSERRHPLLLGSPRTLKWRVEMTLPDGGRIKRMPQSTKIETECLTVERKISVKGQVVTAEQEVVIQCERIKPADYPAYRVQSEKILRFLNEELVVRMPGRTLASSPKN